MNSINHLLRQRFSRVASRRPGSARGFTFLEIMLVVAILGLVMMVAMPDFRSLDTRASLEGASRQLVGLFRYARARAIATGDYTSIDFQFPVDSAHRYVYSEKADEDRDDSKSWRRDEEPSRVQEFELPERCYFTFFDTYEELIYSDGVKLYFYPDGTASPALINIGQERPARSGDGVKTKYYTIEVYRATGLTRSNPGRGDDEEEDVEVAEPLAGRRDKNDDFTRQVQLIRGYD